MPIHNMKTFKFTAPNFTDWKEAAVLTLKGKPFDALYTKTIEGIELNPLYTKDDLEKLEVSRVTKPAFGWTVAQPVSAANGQQFVEQMKESLARGNEAIAYNGLKPLVWAEQDIKQVAELITQHPILFTEVQGDDPILQAFTYIEEAQREKVTGICISDTPVIPEGFPGVRSKGADLWMAHHEGADAVTELALSLAIAAELAEQAPLFEEFTNNFFARFATDLHFFMEISKFRAFRVLWKLFNEAYGVKDAKQVPLLGITSIRSYSKLDPYVNLLRGGNEAFAAILGGADWLTVLPHDVLTGTSTSSNRYARNMQLILKEETHVDAVLDPAGGSYFIESLTEELIRKSWAKFLEIQDNGGYQAFLQSGELSKLYVQRQKEMATGKKTSIGTNVYAELTDVNYANEASITVSRRLAEPFENIRSKSQEQLPKTVVLNFGALKDHKPRTDFVSGFLAVGGIEAILSPSLESTEQAISWLQEQQPDYAVICASPAETEEAVTSFLASYRGDCPIDTAGKYPAETADQWLAAGLNGFIFAGQDKIDKLNAIINHKKGGRSVE